MNSLQTHTADSFGYEVLEPCGRAARAVALRAPFAILGKPAALLYRAVSEQIRRRRITGRPQPWSDTTVLSVGNLEIGPPCLRKHPMGLRLEPPSFKHAEAPTRQE